MKNALEVSHLTKDYGSFKLDDVSFTVPGGTIMGLIGENGAGKSTLLRHVTGVYRQDSGSVLIEGNPVYENPAAKSRIASIPDELYYFLSASTRDMMRFYRGFYPRFDVKRYEALKAQSGPAEKSTLELNARASRLGKKTIECRGVTKGFGGRTVVRDFDCMLLRDDRIGIVGANGSDKPDLRFGMKFVELMDIMKGHGFPVFDNAAYIGGICAEGAAHYTRKQLDALTEFVKRPQIGAKGMVYARVEADGNVKSSVDKFYAQEVLQEMKAAFNAKPGDLILILSGDDAMKTRKQLNELRLEMGNQLGLRDKNKFVCLWVVDFPMFEWSDEEGRLMAMHHPFTHPKDEDIPLLDTDPAAVRADAYDMVCNGIEVGGGSIRIHDAQLQAKMFEILGFTPEKAQEQFGFLMNAFKYGAPPHGGLAYGLDRWVSIFAGLDSIRDCIAFPKNNSGRDVMLDAPSAIDQKQLDELNLIVEVKE